MSSIVLTFVNVTGLCRLLFYRVVNQWDFIGE